MINSEPSGKTLYKQNLFIATAPLALSARDSVAHDSCLRQGEFEKRLLVNQTNRNEAAVRAGSAGTAARSTATTASRNIQDGRVDVSSVSAALDDISDKDL